MRTALLACLVLADTSGPVARGKPLASARIEYVDRAFGMLALESGESAGINPRCHFVVVRPGPSGDFTLATGTFSSFLGSANTGCKISITQGSADSIRRTDLVLVYRARKH